MRDIEDVGRAIIGAAIEVHRHLGPGLLESAYQNALEWELRHQGLQVECEKPMPIRYKDVDIDAGYRLDMLVENLIVIENKAVRQLDPVHEAQLITYLKLSGCRLGYLINWNVPLVKDGIKRIVHGL